MNETKNNVTRSGLYLGKDVTGSLFSLEPGNVLIIGDIGHGFETLMNSILCNQLYMSNPKAESIIVYMDEGVLSPEWLVSGSGCELFNKIYGESDLNKRPVFEEAVSSVGRIVADRVGLIKLYGDIPEDVDRKHYTVFFVIGSKTKELEYSASFNQLLNLAYHCKQDIRINVDIVLALQHHMPINCDGDFDYVVCTPLGDDEFSRMVIGSDLAARGPEKYGVIYYHKWGKGLPASKLTVQYRPDTFIRKLLKAFKVKSGNKSDK